MLVYVRRPTIPHTRYTIHKAYTSVELVDAFDVPVYGLFHRSENV